MAGPRRKQLVNKTARPRNNWPFKEIWVSSSGQLVSNDLSLRRQPTPGMKVRIKVKDDQTLGFTITRLGNQDAGLLWFWSSPISEKKQPAHLSNWRVFSEPLWIFAVASCLYFDYECSDFHRSKNDKIVLYQVIVVPPPFNFNILIWSSSLGHRRWPPVAPQPGLPHPDYVKTRQKPQQGFWFFIVLFREDINWKKNVFFRALPELPNPPPMTPIRATWPSFFGSRNSRFESQFRTKNTIYTI